jgi:hypothetical protein
MAAAPTQGRTVDHTDARIGIDVWIAGAAVAALALRLLRLDTAPLWLDEVLTVDWTTLPTGALVHTALSDNHLPLYFILLKGWLAITGHSVWALRLLSALCSAAAVPLIAATAAVVAGRHAARWAAWMAAIAPFAVHHGQEARMYAVVLCLAAAHALLLVRAVDRADQRLGPGFVVIGWMLAAMHHYAALFVAAELAVIALRVRRTPRWPAMRPVLALTAAVPMAAFAAAALVARHQGGGRYALGLAALPGSVWAMVGGYALLPSAESLHGDGVRTALAYAPVAALGLSALAVVAARGWRALAARDRMALGIPLVVALALPFAAHLVADVGLNPRYAAAGFPMLIAWLAAGMPSRLARNGASAAAVALIAIMGAGTAWHFADPGHGREDVAGAAQWLDANVAPDQPLLVTSFEMEILARHHWPGHALQLYPDFNVAVAADTAEQIAAALPFHGAPRVYYVFGRAWVSDPQGALRRALLARYNSCMGARVRGIDILCLEAPGA